MSSRVLRDLRRQRPLMPSSVSTCPSPDIVDGCRPSRHLAETEGAGGENPSASIKCAFRAVGSEHGLGMNILLQLDGVSLSGLDMASNALPVRVLSDVKAATSSVFTGPSQAGPRHGT